MIEKDMVDKKTAIYMVLDITVMCIAVVLSVVNLFIESLALSIGLNLLLLLDIMLLRVLLSRTKIL